MLTPNRCSLKQLHFNWSVATIRLLTMTENVERVETSKNRLYQPDLGVEPPLDWLLSFRIEQPQQPSSGRKTITISSWHCSAWTGCLTLNYEIILFWKSTKTVVAVTHKVFDREKFEFQIYILKFVSNWKDPSRYDSCIFKTFPVAAYTRWQLIVILFNSLTVKGRVQVYK